MPQCITKSALDKNLNASATSTKANTFFTVSNQPPDLGSDFSKLGKIANKPKRKASEEPKPDRPAVNGQAPPLGDATSKERKMGPVHEKDTIARVSDMKKIPPILPIPPRPSA